MKDKQVGITKPLLVASNLLNFATDNQQLLNKLSFVDMLYGKIRDKLKDGDIRTIDDVKNAVNQLPTFMQQKIEDKNFIETKELEAIYSRIVKLSKLIALQSNSVDVASQDKPEEITKLEEDLSCGGTFTVNIDQDQLSHAGHFSVVSVLPFTSSLKPEEKDLLFSYLDSKEAAIAAMKLANTQIVSQIEREQPIESVSTFGKPSFLAMATTATVKNTDNISLFADLATTASVLNNDPRLNLKLDKKDIEDLLLLVESEAKKNPDIAKGKEVFKKILENKVNQSSPEEKAFYEEYLSTLDTSRKWFRDAPLLEEIGETTQKVTDAAERLTDKGIDTKNLVQNLKDTSQRIEEMNVTRKKEELQNIKGRRSESSSFQLR